MRTLFPLLLVWLLLPPLKADTPCLEQTATLINRESGPNSPYTAYEISEGLYTNLVRIVPKDPHQKSWVEKRIADIGKFIIESMAYEKLGEVIQGPSARSTFELVKAEPQANQVIILEDVKGIGLHKVLRDPYLSSDIKASLRTVYKMKLNALDRLIREKFTNIGRVESDWDGLPAYHYVIRESNKTSEVFIKPDNIVVTFDPENPAIFKMKIIDGY